MTLASSSERLSEPSRRRHAGLSRIAIDYLIGEKLISFGNAARDQPAFARELPMFLAAIWQTFNAYEIAGYVASRKPATRNRIRQLLYWR